MQNETVAIAQEKGELGSILNGALLIAGTSIGAGMLALPVVSGVAGFLPAMVVNTLCWLFMLATGLLLMEATLWMDGETNILSMAKRFLGPIGRWIGGGCFLFLYYCLLVAYFDGGAPLLANAIGHYFGLTLTGLGAYVTFATLFGGMIYLGTHLVGRINWILMMSLIVSYILLIGVGSSEVQTSLLSHTNWGLSLTIAPILFSAYGYHNVIPTISNHLKGNPRQLRWAIIVGTAIPFLVYSLWQWVMIGTIPIETLNEAAKEGIPITQALQVIAGHPWISRLGAYFGFFALVTSFLGVSLSMVDFLADGLQTKKSPLNRLFLCLAVFLPPMLFGLANPGIFISALEYAGGFGEAILNGLIPIGMVWVGRYKMNLSSPYSLPGGRLLLATLTAITLFIIGYEAQKVLL